jgi:putative ABC transport system permease protein
MRTIDFVTKESFRRIRKSIAGVLFILLGIGIFVACQTINEALHDRTKEQLLRFGANIIVQPKGEPFDLYSGTVRGGILLPEYYADKTRAIEHSSMLVAISPKLYERFEISGRSLLVVGITPDERKAKPWWLIDNNVLTNEFPMGKEILLGHYAAAHMESEFLVLGDPRSQVKLGDETFRVSGVLDETGSPDDFMAFVPLATLQELVQKAGMVNLIEVSTSCISCKAMDIYGIAGEIDEVLPPDAKVLTVKQIAEAQMGTLKKVMGFTTIIYVVVLVLCAVLLMNYMSGAVDERRREIGMLLAMGMDPRKIQVIFVLKLLVFAGIGGLLGYVMGSGISIFLGPMIADASVSPILYLLPISLAISIGLSIISSIIPSRRISRLDPVEALREV